MVGHYNSYRGFLAWIFIERSIMIPDNAIIDNIVARNGRTLILRYGVPVAWNDYQFEAQLVSIDSKTQYSFNISKSVTDTQIILILKLPAVTTALLKPYEKYIWDLKVTNTDNDLFNLIEGDVTVLKRT